MYVWVYIKNMYKGHLPVCATKVRNIFEKSLICIKNPTVFAHNSRKSLFRVEKRRIFAPSKRQKDNKFKFKVGYGPMEHTKIKQRPSRVKKERVKR